MPTPLEILLEDVKIAVDDACANPREIDPKCPACGGAMWDQRHGYKGEGKKNPKAPDFKCKNKECLSPPGKDGKRWPTALWMNNIDPRATRADWDDVQTLAEEKGINILGLTQALEIMGASDWSKAKKSYMTLLREKLTAMEDADPDDAAVALPESEDAAPESGEELEKLSF